MYHHSYEYDSLNQLARENYCESGCSLLTPTGFTKTFAYDSHGNRTLTNRYAYTTGSLDGKPILSSFSFLYGNSWDDQLTSAFGFTYTYDAQGNVLTMVNTLSGISISFGWEGRTLVYYHYVDTVNNIDKIITYKYDDQGYRTEKIVNGVLHQYYLDGDRVLVEKFGSNVLYYTYGADGTLLSANINGQEYFYQRNLLGDIIGLYDINGDLDVTYEYDAWGNLLSLNDYSGANVGTLNPYRYRGYRFDTDTGWYYLTSRYYNPQTGRFINADGNIGEIGQTLSHNMYAYCANNPVMYTDSDGWLSSKIWGIICVAAILVVAIAVTIATLGIGSVAATIAITSTISIVSQSLVIGKAQTNYSKSEGDTESEVIDDTIDAISDFLFSPETSSAYYIPSSKLVSPLMKGIGSKGISIGQGISNAFSAGGKSGIPAPKGYYGIAYGFSAVQLGITILVWNDEQACSWVADKYGWNPQ